MQGMNEESKKQGKEAGAAEKAHPLSLLRRAYGI
jgi:hypothetical protein